MAWQQTNSYPYAQQQSAVPPTYYPAGNYPNENNPGVIPKSTYSEGTTAFGGVESTGNSYPGYGTTNTIGNNFGFSDKTIRNGFIRKVYLILMCQLAISAAFIALFVYNDNVKVMFQNSGLIWVSFFITIACLFIMSCFDSARRTPPTNYIFLFIFTLAESFMLGVISSVYDPNVVLLAVVLCAVICFGLTIFAFQTKIDFTVMGGILFVSVLILFIFGLLLLFWHSNVANLVYSCLGALIFSIFLVYDTQLMIGGENHKYSISPEEYVFAALNLYIDVIQIFLMILRILGSSRN